MADLSKVSHRLQPEFVWGILGAALMAIANYFIVIVELRTQGRQQREFLASEIRAQIVSQNLSQIVAECASEDAAVRRLFMMRIAGALGCEVDRVHGCVIEQMRSFCSREDPVSPREEQVALLTPVPDRIPRGLNRPTSAAPARAARLFILAASEDQSVRLRPMLEALGTGAANIAINIEPNIDVVSDYSGATQVRYFHQPDRDKAVALIRALRPRFPDIVSEPRFIGGYERQPDAVSGWLELWIGPNASIVASP